MDLYKFFMQPKNMSPAEKQYWEVDRAAALKAEEDAASLKRAQINDRAALQTTGREKAAPMPISGWHPPMQTKPETMQAPIAGQELQTQQRMPSANEVPDAFQVSPYRGITAAGMAEGIGRPTNNMPDNLKQQLTEALEKQKLSANDSGELFKNYLGLNVQGDISPMLALLDKTKGQKILNAYRKPTTSEEYAGVLSKLQNTSNDNQKGVLDSLVKLAGQRTNDRYTDNLLRQQGREAGYTKDFMKDLQNKVDKPVSNYLDTRKQLDVLEDVFKEGDYAKVVSKLESYARFVNGMKGSGTEGDIARQLPDMLSNSLSRAKIKLVGGREKIDPDSVAPLIEVVRQARAATESSYGDLMNNYKYDFEQRAGAQGLDLMQIGRPGYNMFQNKMKAMGGSTLPGASATPRAQATQAAPAPKAPRKVELNGKILTEGVDF